MFTHQKKQINFQFVSFSVWYEMEWFMEINGKYAISIRLFQNTFALKVLGKVYLTSYLTDYSEFHTYQKNKNFMLICGKFRLKSCKSKQYHRVIPQIIEQCKHNNAI